VGIDLGGPLVAMMGPKIGKSGEIFARLDLEKGIRAVTPAGIEIEVMIQFCHRAPDDDQNASNWVEPVSGRFLHPVLFGDGGRLT